MFNKTMSDWINSFDSDQPTSDGDCANAWSPAVWDDMPAPETADPAAYASGQSSPRMRRDARATRFMGGAPNHG